MQAKRSTAIAVEGAKRKGKQPKTNIDDDNDDESHVYWALKRQCMLPSMLKDACSAKLCNALAEYVMEDIQPFTTVHFAS